MSIAITSARMKPMILGDGTNGEAHGYFRNFRLVSNTKEPRTIRQLISGLKLQIDFSSLDIPDEENRWKYYDSSGYGNPMSKELKKKLRDIYSKYLKLAITLEKPQVQDWKSIAFTFSNGTEINFNYALHYHEDEPLRIWKEIDIRELPGCKEIKEIEWSSFNRDSGGKYIGIEPRWDEEHGFKPDLLDGKENPGQTRNLMKGFLPGYTINLSFLCQLEGEIQLEE